MTINLKVEGEALPTTVDAPTAPDHLRDTAEMVPAAQIVPPTPGLFVPLDGLFMAWLEARASAYGEPVELHASRLLREKWQTDTWRLQQQRGGMAGLKAGGA